MSGDHSIGSTRRAGARFAIYPALLTLLADLPGRRALALRETSYGHSGWAYLVGGLAADLACVLPFIALCVALFWILLLAIRSRSALSDRWGNALLLALLAIPTWVLSVSGTEFKLQRGLYPTLGEIRAGLGDSTFVHGAWPTLIQSRYLPASLASLAATVALLFILLSTTAAWPLTRDRLIGFLSGSMVICTLGAAILLSSSRLFPSIDHPSALYPPLSTVLGGFGFGSQSRALRPALEAASFTPEESRAGARALGFSDEVATRLSACAKGPCGTHPLLRPLDSDSPKSSLLTAFTELSSQLFAVPEAIDVWQIAIESLRADDLSALDPAAAPGIMPFIDSLYGSPQTIAFTHAYQAGYRTAQALGALMCGLGALPFNLAIGRDLGHLPLRCLPDVLYDAGFQPHVYYGSFLTFDNMLEFFRRHHVTTTQKPDLPPELPTGVWHAVSDRALYGAALADAGARRGPQYNFILTLSSHTPYDRPEDFSPSLAARVQEALRKKESAPLAPDDRKRLEALAYADDALRHFIELLERSPRAASSIVVISADHATADDLLWRGPTATALEATAQIPLLVYFPRALVERAGLAAALGRTRLVAATELVSENDLPALLLALLSSSPQLRALPAERRWHTLGGSRATAELLLPGMPRARLFGVDAQSRIFVVEEGAAHATATGDWNLAYERAAQLRTPDCLTVPLAALLSAFLKSCAQNECARY